MPRLLSRIVLPFLIAALLVGLFPVSGHTANLARGKADPALLELAAANPTRRFPIIVQAGPAGPASTGRAVERARANRAEPVASLTFVGATSALADYQSIAALNRDPDIQFVYYDMPLRTLDDRSNIVPEPSGQPAISKNVYEDLIGADDAWADGYTGKGVAVALLDSGIYPATDLTLPVNRIVARVDMVGDGSDSPDPGGHGTHLAGIIAGSGSSAPASLARYYRGVAPGAGLVDVRVVDRDGNTNISTVLRGVEWVVQNRHNYNIRAMNLSLGAAVPKQYSYRLDPLAAAVELAWLSGIVVVTAAGNAGPAPRSITTPGTDPLVITVGAMDDAGTASAGDDTIASFSARGPTPDGISKPDLVAPGRRIVSLRSPGSYLEELLPERLVRTSNGAVFFRLSGTSMSAAVVTGVVALLLEKRPDLRPDQVKYVLTHTTKPIRSASIQAAGSGRVDANAALDSKLNKSANNNKRPADGVALALASALNGQPLKWRKADAAGRDWSKADWNNILWDGITWDNILWDNILWDNIMWDNVLWDNILWDNILWDNIMWDIAVPEIKPGRSPTQGPRTDRR